MTRKLKYSQLIERFIAGEMNEDELRWFGKELQSNAELTGELKLDKDLDNILLDEDVVEFRRKLISVFNESKQKEATTKIVRMQPRRWQLAAAAAIAVLMIAGGALLLTQQRSYTAEKLFSMYYDTDRTIELTRSGNANIVEAILKFQQKDFQGASLLFAEILDKDSSNIAVWFYNGISYIETNRIDDAVKAFRYIIDDKNNLYVEHAEWYLGLCYLKNEQIDYAVEQFRKIAADQKNYHNKEANKLLEKLGRK
jgi:tetratricopeptide (TPR) repeat protein